MTSSQLLHPENAQENAPNVSIAPVNRLYFSFLQALEKQGFSGEISPDSATRLSLATDNSIYQILPQGAVFPKHVDDLLCLFKLAGSEAFQTIQFAPRGGGTGTNGQALNTGLVIDVSRHMCELLELNLAAGYVRVQPGIVRDQLNRLLAPHGVFFAPSTSTSNRATVGGMASTDACGQGSRIYGRTSNHVLGMQIVLADGEALHCEQLDMQAYLDVMSPVINPVRDRHSKKQQQLIQDLSALVCDKSVLVAEKFPKLNRFFTGYNMDHLQQGNDFNLSALICGSEGTLAMVSELTLRLTPLPKHKQLLVFSYRKFDDALRDATRLVAFNPDAIETIDDTIIGLAKNDVIWHRVGDLLGSEQSEQIQAINLVEFSHSNNAQALTQQVNAICQRLADQGDSSAIHYVRIEDSNDMAALWELRKKGVGLLGNVKGAKRPIPFVEDTAVPPEHLADYIQEFRALLDKEGIRYGMFGHVDAGCLHVRPALNMRDPEDAKKIRRLSDAVNALVQKHGGVMWGEHGKGFRSEYTPSVIGDELFQAMRQIKTWFDPYNQLNPGKICTPLDSDQVEHAELVKVDDPRTRGQQDARIDANTIDTWEPVIACNGNGACFNYEPEAEMCPSFKATQDRVQSPKGRAGLLREWLAQQSQGKVDKDFEEQVYKSMQTCLACKACTTQCPIKVDIPTYRSRFLQAYFAKRKRPLRSYLIAHIEEFSMWAGPLSSIVNFVSRRTWVRHLVKGYLGMQHLPKLYRYQYKALLKRTGAVPFSDLSNSNTAINHHTDKQVIIVQDTFTSCFDLPTLEGIIKALKGLGFTPVLLPLGVSGKAKHVQGLTQAFTKTATRQTHLLQQAGATGLPLVAVEPSVGLSYREEYQSLGKGLPKVLLLQEWLSEALKTVTCPDLSIASHTSKQSIHLLAHCSEKALVPTSNQLWQDVFHALGLAVTTPKVGCCGMAGTFGHEVSNAAIAETLYAMSWQKPVAEADLVLATGYSCRSQTYLHGTRTKHPLVFISELLPNAS